MTIEQRLIKQAALASGIAENDLKLFFAEGKEQVYEANEWLFHESTPRNWAGIVLKGDVDLVRGLHGSSNHVGTIIRGALISEGAFLEGDSHSNGAYTRNGATVWQNQRIRLKR